MDVEELRRKIMEKTGMSRSELDKLVEKKIMEYAGLLTELGALYTIAKEKGVEVSIDESLRTRKKISELKPGEKGVSVVGRVIRVFPPREFRKNGRKGRYASVILSDGSGEIRLVLWNRDADLVSSGRIKKGTVLEVINATVEEFREKLSLRLGYNGRLLIDPDVDMELPEVRTHSVAELTPGMNDVDVELIVQRVFEAREGEPSFTSFLGSDKTWKIRVVVWGRTLRLLPGYRVFIRSGYVKEGRLGPELHVGERGSVEVKEVSYPRRRLSEVEEGERIEVRAAVVGILSQKPYKAVCRDCGGEGEWVDGKWVCRECGSTNVRVTPLLSLRIDDGYGSLRAVLFGEVALKVYGSAFPEGAIERALSLLGKDMIFRGVITKNEVTDRLEMVVNDVEEPDVDAEIHRMLEELRSRSGETPEKGSREG